MKAHCTSCVLLGTTLVDGVWRTFYRCDRSGVVTYIAQHGPGPHDAVSVPLECLLALGHAPSQLFHSLYWVAIMDTSETGGLDQGFALVQKSPGGTVIFLISPFLENDEVQAVQSAGAAVLNASQGRPTSEDELRRLEGGVLAELAKISAVGGPDRWALPVLV